MNPIVIAGGIIALLLLNRKSKAQTQMPQSSGPIPSPANPSGLDKPMGPSTTSDPITSPANPAGLDVPSESISSPANPDVLAKDVEPSGEYEVVSDGNWTPSPANPKGLQEELMLDTSTPVSSPANPKGLVDILISNQESKSGSSVSEFKKTLNKIVDKNPSTELRFAQNEEQLSFLRELKGTPYSSYKDFAAWVERKRNPTELGSLRGGRMSTAARLRLILRFLDERKELNRGIINQWIQHNKAEEAKELLRKNKIEAAKKSTKPKVFAGKVLDENGNYVTPKGQQDCPIGYNYLSNAGWTGCLPQEQYEEKMMMFAKGTEVMLPQKQWSKIKTLEWLFNRGGIKDKAYLTAPSAQLVELNRKATYQCNNEWCNILRELVLTDSTSLVTDRVQFKNTVYGKLDGKWVALHPMPIKVGGRKRTKNLVYIVFPISKEDYDFYKERAKWYAMYLKKKK